MLDYSQIHIFDAVTTCGRYQGRLLLLLILHNAMHDITSTLPVDVLQSARVYPKWPPSVNRRRAPGVIRLGFNGYGLMHDVTENRLNGKRLKGRLRNGKKGIKSR